MGDYWNPSLPGLRRLSGKDVNIRDLADQLIQVKFLKAQRELSEPSEREKFEWQRAVDIQNQQMEEAKFVTNKFIEAYNSAGSPLEKRHVYEQSRAWLPGLPERIQRFVNATFANTPLSDAQRKILDFQSVHQRPEMTVTFDDDTDAWARQKFAQQEYDFQLKSLMGHQDLKRVDFVPTPDGGAMYKNPDTGMVTQITPDRMEVLESLPLMKKHDVTIEQAISNGGKVELEEKLTTDGSQKIMLRSTYDIGSGKKTWNRIPMGVEVSKQFPAEVPEGIQDFIGMLQIDEDSRPDEHEMLPMVEQFQEERIRIGKMAGDVNAKAKELNKILKRTIGAQYPNWNFRLIDFDPERVDTDFLWFGSELDPKTKESIRAWPGTRTFVPGAEGSVIPVWEHNGHYYSHMGEYLGTEDAMLQWASVKRSSVKREKR